MAEYNKKWADLFPATIGNQTRPSAGVDNTLQYETDKFPQHIANDPVRYDKMNAVVSQAMSNDERLNEKINKTSDDLAAHNKDPKAHATGIAGNAATATKLQTPRTISLTGNVSGSTTFDGSGNANINTTVNTMNNQGIKTAIKDGTEEPYGLNLYKVYNNGYPATYGNLISIGGTGGGELLAGWSNVDHGVEHLYYRNRRNGGALWSNWSTIAFTTDINNYAPTKTGGGASGTWPISISGNASSATKAVNDGNGANIANTYLKKATVIDVIYPVGSIYMSMSATNPATLFGVGTWKRISQGRMLLGADDSTYKAGATGGEETHTLTAEEMPAHSHSGTTSTNGNHTHGVPDCNNYDENGNGFDSGSSGVIGYVNTTSAGDHNHTFTTDNSGGSAAHNNMSPYLVCYIWQRTA